MKKTLVLILTLLEVACSSPRPNFFQPVGLKTTDMVYSDVKSTILINQVLLPAEASRPQITTLGDEDYEVKIDEFNRWGASPEKLVQRVLNENLSLLLPNATVENQTPLRKNYVYAVAVEVLEMSGRLNEKATLKATYFIKNKQGKTLKSGRFVKSIPIDGDYEAYVPALSKLLGDLSDEIAQTLAFLK